MIYRRSETWFQKYITMVIYLESFNSKALKPSSDTPTPLIQKPKLPSPLTTSHLNKSDGCTFTPSTKGSGCKSANGQRDYAHDTNTKQYCLKGHTWKLTEWVQFTWNTNCWLQGSYPSSYERLSFTRIPTDWVQFTWIPTDWLQWPWPCLRRGCRLNVVLQTLKKNYCKTFVYKIHF